MVFVFGSVYVVDYVYRPACVKTALHPRDEAYLIEMDKLFDMLLQSVCQYFIEDFCIYVHQYPARLEITHRGCRTVRVAASFFFFYLCPRMVPTRCQPELSL